VIRWPPGLRRGCRDRGRGGGRGWRDPVPATIGGCLASPPACGAELDAIADEDGLAFRLRRRAADHAGLGRGQNRRRRDEILRLADRALHLRFRRDLGRLAAALTADVHRDDRRPDVGGLALGHQQSRDRALIRAGQLDDCLRGLDLHDDLIDGDLVTGLDVPSDDVGLGQAFADIREPELLEI
jgi:hypothetical protein